MKTYQSIFAAQVLMVSACTTAVDNRHVSASGKYEIRFFEAKGESDSRYQIRNRGRPNLHYPSPGGATPLASEYISWSPTEKTCAIIERRPGSIGLPNGTGLIRILYIVSIAENSGYHQIYMRPFEVLHFNDEKVRVLSVSDEVLRFRSASGRITKEFGIDAMVEESHRQYALNLKDDEILD
ncbi:hypothetical protein HZ994_14245 [Akkermansiaceae bacterium]|nr:hypothetical protein HZ994_14245 [Akkermansiaceae bacterium]